MRVDLSLPTQFKLTLDIEGAAINVQKAVQTDLGLPNRSVPIGEASYVLSEPTIFK